MNKIAMPLLFVSLILSSCNEIQVADPLDSFLAVFKEKYNNEYLLENGWYKATSSIQEYKDNKLTKLTDSLLRGNINFSSGKTINGSADECMFLSNSYIYNEDVELKKQEHLYSNNIYNFEQNNLLYSKIDASIVSNSSEFVKSNYMVNPHISFEVPDLYNNIDELMAHSNEKLFTNITYGNNTLNYSYQSANDGDEYISYNTNAAFSFDTNYEINTISFVETKYDFTKNTKTIHIINIGKYKAMNIFPERNINTYQPNYVVKLFL